MGAFAEVLGIRPWEWELLTVAETKGLERYIDDRNEEIRRASEG